MSNFPSTVQIFKYDPSSGQIIQHESKNCEQKQLLELTKRIFSNQNISEKSEESGRSKHFVTSRLEMKVDFEDLPPVYQDELKNKITPELTIFSFIFFRIFQLCSKLSYENRNKEKEKLFLTTTLYYYLFYFILFIT